MSQSTPLNQLPSNQDNQNENDLVNDILNEMELLPEPNNDLNADSLNYAMDQSQVPPEKMDVNFLNNQTDQNVENDNDVNVQENNNVKSSKKSFFGLPNINLGFGGSKNNSEKGLMEKCMDNVKLVVLIFVLVFIVSLPQFNRFVFTKLPKLLNENGEINIKGVGFKALVVSVLFLISSNLM